MASGNMASGMKTLVVLFNLKPGVDAAAYEQWARSQDLPTVRALGSIAGFEVYKTSGILGASTPAPYGYVEVLHVRDMNALMGDIGTPSMQAIASAFQSFADNPCFMISESL